MKKTNVSRKTEKTYKYIQISFTAGDARDYFRQFKPNTPLTQEIWDNFCRHLAQKKETK